MVARETSLRYLRNLENSVMSGLPPKNPELWDPTRDNAEEDIAQYFIQAQQGIEEIYERKMELGAGLSGIIEKYSKIAEYRDALAVIGFNIKKAMDVANKIN